MAVSSRPRARRRDRCAGAVARDPAGDSERSPARRGPARRSEFLYFALRNWKFVVRRRRSCSCSSPSPSSARCSRRTRRSTFTGPTDSRRRRTYWFGTTSFGQDVFSQFVYGLRAAFLVGAVGGGIAWLVGAGVGFTAGYRGGWVDDVLNMLTNVVLVIPTLAILIIVAAYLNVHSYATEALLIGLTSWPWAARAVRAQTFSLKTREFVDIARLSGRRTRQIITTRDRAEHELVPAHDVHPPLRRRDPDRRVARLPRARAVDVDVARADDEQRRSSRARCSLGVWWWFVPPGIGIIAVVGGLYVMNVGLDEIFNPKLREQ